MRLLLLCLLWGCLPVWALAQLGTPLEQALLRLDFAAADRVVAAETDPLRRVFARHHIRFVQAVADPAPQHLEAFWQAATTADNAYEQLLEQPLRRALQAELYWEQAVLKVLDQRYWSAFWDIRKAHNLAEAELRRYPNSRQPLRLLGLVEAGVASMPSSYRWAAGVLGFPGRVERGLTRLNTAANQAEVLPVESTLLLHYVQRQLSPEPSDLLQPVFEADTLAAVRRYLWALHLLEQRNSRAAMALLGQVPMPAQFAYWAHASGKAALLAGQYDMAVPHLKRFLRTAQGRLLRRDAQFRLGQALLLSGQAAAAHAAFAQLDTLPASGFDDDSYATRQAKLYAAKLPQGPDLVLLRARLAFDGGEATLAFGALRSLNLNQLTVDQQVEYHYRCGRLWDEGGQAEAARTAYLACQQLRPVTAQWMVAYSRYYLGRQAERASQYPQARQWYELALTYDGSDYRLGLEQKVKAALQRLGQ